MKDRTENQRIQSAAAPTKSGVVTAVAAAILSIASFHSVEAQVAPLQLSKTIALPGVTGKFDHFAVDLTGHRLFAAATGNHSVEVIDLATDKVQESIAGLGKPHGLAWVAETGSLYVSDGTLAELRVYQGSPLKLAASIKLSDDADDMVLDPATGLLYVGHGGGSAAVPGRIAVIDTKSNKLVENLASSAHPEALDIDPEGHRIYANIADSGEIVVIDGTSHAVVATWKVARAKDNVPVAYAADRHALVIGCRTPAKIVLVDAEGGKEVSDQPSGTGADDLFYDAASHRAYLIGGGGAVDVYEVSAEKQLKPVGSVKTASGAKTGLLVTSLHTLFVGIPSAGQEPAKVRVYTTQ